MRSGIDPNDGADRNLAAGVSGNRTQQLVLLRGMAAIKVSEFGELV